MANAYRPSRVCSRITCVPSAQTTTTHSTNGTPNRLPSPKNAKLLGMRVTGSPLVTIRVKPRMMPSVPSVTIKGAIRRRVVRKPFTDPQNSPVARPARTPTATGDDDQGPAQRHDVDHRRLPHHAREIRLGQEMRQPLHHAHTPVRARRST